MASNWWKLIGAVALWETGHWFYRRRKRRELYAAALARAKETGRPLVVIGDPDGGLTHGDYGYGDVCVDLTGCPKAPSGVRRLKHDITKRLPLAGDSSVVFVACVLECVVGDVAAAWKEILRIAGGTENVYNVRVIPWSLTAFFYPGIQRRSYLSDPIYASLPAGHLGETVRKLRGV